MEQKLYYDTPTQVKFWDEDDEHYLGGIAYHTEIICGCCGGIFEIVDIYNCSDVDEPIIAYQDWINIEAEIRGNN